MKNKIFIPIFILLSFFFINNVKALDITFDYDGTYSSSWVNDNKIELSQNIITYLNSINPDLRYILTTNSDLNDNSGVPNSVLITFLKTESERGSYFITSSSRGTDYSYSFRLNYTDSLQGVSQNGYLTQSNNLQYYSNIRCYTNETWDSCKSRIDSVDFTTTSTANYVLLTDLGAYLNYSSNNHNLYSICRSPINPSNCPSTFYVNNLRMFLYSSFDIPITGLNNSNYFTPFIFKYGDNEIKSQKLDKFYTYFDMLNIPTVPDNTISDFGSNSYGVKSYNLDISNSLGSNVNCVKDRDFDNNGYCNFYYSDFGSDVDSDILNSDFDITFSFDENTSHFPLITGKYYVFTYRTISDINIIPTLVMGYSGNATIPIVIDDIKIINNGLNKDYQLILHTNNPDSNYSLNSLKIFNIPLKDYSYTITDFKLGVYNSYKYTQFNEFPTQSDLTSDLHNNSLNTINLGTTDSFFSKFSVNDHGLSTFITSPIRLFQSLRNSTCQTIILPVPHLGNIQLPCISSIFQQNLPELFNIYQIIMSGIICYYIGLNYFRIIKNAFNPEDDRIEVQDL